MNVARLDEKIDEIRKDVYVTKTIVTQYMLINGMNKEKGNE